MINSVNILGAGNVATHIAKELKGKLEIRQILSRTYESAQILANEVGAEAVRNIKNIEPADLTIVSISDDSIVDVISELPKELNVVHTSGSIGMEVLAKFDQYGILYPLQSFSKNREVNFNDIPILIEGVNQDYEQYLTLFCKEFLSKKIVSVNSEKRAAIHLAAVIANNFTTALLAESEQILLKNDIDFDILKPLLLETIHKVFRNGARESLTGPAARGDQKVMDVQMKSLESDQMKMIYRQMSEMIQKLKVNS